MGRFRPSQSSEFRVYSSLTRQTDQDSPISRSLASNGQRRHTNVRMHMQTPTPHADTFDHASPSSPLRANLDPREVSSPHIVALLAVGTRSTMAQTGVSGPVVVDGESFLDALFACACRG
eukprot:scaffold52833_cov40-Phaeocystis_antarctica.AAC.1